MTVLWTDDRLPPNGTVEYQAPHAATLVDMMGNKVGEAKAGAVVAVGADPLYLVDESADR